jgi:hypothetical protein
MMFPIVEKLILEMVNMELGTNLHEALSKGGNNPNFVF